MPNAPWRHRRRVVRLVSKSTSESDEHAWLKKYVAEVASNCGLESTSEQPLINGQVRADVFVADVERGRIGFSEFARTFQNELTATPTLFGCYAHDVCRKSSQQERVVQLPVCAGQDQRTCRAPILRVALADPTDCCRTVAEMARKRQLFVRASGTVLQSPLARHNRRSIDVALEAIGVRLCKTDSSKPSRSISPFLVQVWSGERHWHPRGAIHSSAGWALDCDVEDYHRWKAELRAAQSARRTNLSTRVPPCTDVTVGHPKMKELPPLNSTLPRTVSPSTGKADPIRNSHSTNCCASTIR